MIIFFLNIFTPPFKYLSFIYFTFKICENNYCIVYANQNIEIEIDSVAAIKVEIY